MKKEKKVERVEYSPCPLCNGDPNCILCKGERKYVSARWTEIIINEGNITIDEDIDLIIDAEEVTPLLPNGVGGTLEER